MRFPHHASGQHPRAVQPPTCCHHELLPKIVDNYKMRRVEILCREADEKILEFQNAGDMERLVEWIKKKNAMIKVRSRINEKLKRTI